MTNYLQYPAYPVKQRPCPKSPWPPTQYSRLISFRKNMDFYDFENILSKIFFMDGQLFLIGSGSRKANRKDNNNESTSTRNSNILE